jgi:hypothetical protein
MHSGWRQDNGRRDAGSVVEGAKKGVHAGRSKNKGEDVGGQHEAKNDTPDVLSKHVCEIGPGGKGGIAEGNTERNGIGDESVVDDVAAMLTCSKFVRLPFRIVGSTTFE